MEFFLTAQGNINFGFTKIVENMSKTVIFYFKNFIIFYYELNLLRLANSSLNVILQLALFVGYKRREILLC